ncbi:M24 family metallopeptidase [Pseudoteredinibacter isoporae]|uniref:Xaa-Pro dipeptidase n=1 Tax=Pseudoteredinibacter isoporae TaxID=570281 RepID=A0A7X0MXA9_9GAMM|nr:Xaa-Pro peptidase family protein [Pseudoteredinibacter isoporae]MBB6520712.1 Xaa-Pro dipeptidase [Pseudoteredinibacter isoporae]NHO86279.1 aminopeptidase P family protein [Pseudoteredinibacter isoporae]NIB25270.1 aminopeptidase P family protein [Pseudoteredinibacter isoporae]
MSPAAHSQHPDNKEVQARITKLQQQLLRQELDFYLCHEPANIFYLSNFANFVHERPFLLLIPSAGQPIFIAPKLELEHVKSRVVIDLEYAEYLEFPATIGNNWYDRLADHVQEHHRIGVESQCPLSVYRALAGTAIQSDMVEELRAIKSEFEIQRIQYCCDLLTLGHQTLLDMAYPGQLPLLIHKEVSSQLMQKLLLENPAANLINSKFNAVTQVGAMSGDPHNFREVFASLNEGGPNVTIVQGLANGYGAELERTFFIDRIPEAAQKPFEAMLEARRLAYDLLKPGQCMADIDHQVNQRLRALGYGDNLLHRTGHSFGVTDHEGPFLAEGYEKEIKANMVFSIEPGIYIPGVGGFRFSDTVLITKDGFRKMTSAPESLEQLIVKG